MKRNFQELVKVQGDGSIIDENDEEVIITTHEKASNEIQEDRQEDLSVESNTEGEASDSDGEEAREPLGSHHRDFKWCRRANCDIQGIHRAHLTTEFALAAAEKISISEDPETYMQAIKSAEADR